MGNGKKKKKEKKRQILPSWHWTEFIAMEERKQKGKTKQSSTGGGVEYTLGPKLKLEEEEEYLWRPCNWDSGVQCVSKAWAAQ